MPDLDIPGPTRRRREELPLARRVGSFLIWWVLLMAFWTWIDDSIALPELLVGSGVAFLGALLAEVVQYQADTHVRIRIEWIARGLKLPAEIVHDLGVVLVALWKVVTVGEDPPSGFVAVPVRPGGDSVDDVTRRALLTAGTSVAPNTLVLGIDDERGEMIVHHLVLPKEARDTARARRGTSSPGSGREGI